MPRLLDIHVVAVGDAEIVVEAMPGGEISGQVAQVPLADAHRGVATRLERFGQGDLARRESLRLRLGKAPG